MSLLLARFKSEGSCRIFQFDSRKPHARVLTLDCEHWDADRARKAECQDGVCPARWTATLVFLLIAAIKIQVSHNRNSSYACGTAVFINEQLLVLFQHLEVAMNSISNVSIRAIPETRTGLHCLKAIALSCGLVLGAAL
jgi:hypothetical protein